MKTFEQFTKVKLETLIPMDKLDIKFDFIE